MELVLKFFNGIYALMPMTCSANALREAIAGIDYSFMEKNVLALLEIMVVFLTASFIISRKTMLKEKNTGLEKSQDQGYMYLGKSLN